MEQYRRYLATDVTALSPGQLPATQSELAVQDDLVLLESGIIIIIPILVVTPGWMKTDNSNL